MVQDARMQRLPAPAPFALCLLLAVAGTAPAAATDWPRADVPIEKWREGPVRYLLTFEEASAFRRLESDAERSRFIDRFWARRDPDTRTLINEFRLEFWKRVSDSRRLFTESSKPGWKTDMGRVYILLGPPDDRDTSLEETPSLSRTGIRGAITWRYARSPAPHIGTGLTVVFTRDASGEYSLETDPRVVQRITDGTFLRGDPFGEVAAAAIAMLPERMSEIGFMADLGRLEQVPTEEDLLSFIVSAEEYAGVIPFGARYDYFAGPGGASDVALTLSLHPDPLDPGRASGLPDYLIVGRIDPLDSDGPARSIFLREHEFVPSPRNEELEFHGPYAYQARIRLRPGRYRLSFAAFDRVTRRIGSITEEIEVPAFTPGVLSLSSLCLSSSIEEIRPDEDRDGAYAIGNLRVTPRLLPIYENGETFAVYYQVYSATTDPATRAPSLRVEYQFLVEHPGGYLPIGRPIPVDSAGNSAQGWSFPLKAWPSADFRLRVTVTDSLSGQTASREVGFSVR